MKKYYLSVLLILSAITLSAQELNKMGKDTLRLTLPEAESMFLKQNLALLAQKLSIDSSKAVWVTAKLFNNPEIAISNAFYNPGTGRFFDPETSVQVSQLIKLAGKRKKEMALATSGISIAQFQFYDLLRSLRFALRKDFFNIYFLQQSATLYQLEIASLEKIVPAYKEQVEKGYLAKADLLRIQSQLYTLQAEYANLQTSINEIQGELKLLIRANPEDYFLPIAEPLPSSSDDLSNMNYQSLLDSALINRPDLKLMEANLAFSKNNLTLQKAYAKPDITISANYDRLGGYVKNYNGIGISLPIPLFNRNQGNIHNAEIQIETNKTLYQNGIDVVQSEVSTNFTTALRAEKLLLGFDPNFEHDMKFLIEQVTINFQKKNLSILEFLDYYDSYKQNVLQINQLRFNKVSALEQLNSSVGKIIFNK